MIQAIAGSHESFACELRSRALIVTFGESVRACSWAVLGGGFTVTRHVVWLEVRNDELRPSVHPRHYARERLGAEGVTQAVTLLTSRRISSYVTHTVHDRELQVHATATVGLGNALRAGDPAADGGRVGTINMLVHATTPLTDEALLEAAAIATEAKAASVLDHGIASRVSGRPATGTGTDCVVITCPLAGGTREGYAGKHTRLGAAVGEATYRVVTQGIARWLEVNAGD